MTDQLISQQTVSLSFNRKVGRFSLLLNDMIIQQNVCEFLQTVSFLMGKDIEEHLFNTDSAYDNVRIPLTGSGKTVTLQLGEYIRFKEVYEQQLFLLKLEDMLIHKGVSIQ